MGFVGPGTEGLAACCRPGDGEPPGEAELAGPAEDTALLCSGPMPVGASAVGVRLDPWVPEAESRSRWGERITVLLARSWLARRGGGWPSVSPDGEAAATPTVCAEGRTQRLGAVVIAAVEGVCDDPSGGNIPELGSKATGWSCTPRLWGLALIKRLLMEPTSGLPSNLGVASATCPGTDAPLVGAVVVCMDTTFRTEEPEDEPDAGPEARWPVSGLPEAAAPPTL